jgi:uncharacterized protein
MPTTGETNLSKLLASLTTTLHPDHFVFTTFPELTDIASTGLSYSAIQASIRESEGLTVITTSEAARQHGLPSVYACRKITLNVHSSLEAVGFMAAIAARLKDAGISVNPVSGYYHDHLFVPEEKAEEAVAILEELAEEARRG